MTKSSPSELATGSRSDLVHSVHIYPWQPCLSLANSISCSDTPNKISQLRIQVPISVPKKVVLECNPFLT